MTTDVTEQEAPATEPKPIPRIAWIGFVLFAMATVTFVLIQAFMANNPHGFALVAGVLIMEGFVFGCLYGSAFSPKNNKPGSDLD